MEGKRTKGMNVETLKRKESIEDLMICPFSIGELKRALNGTWNSAPGKDDVCLYSIMLNSLSDEVFHKLVILFNKVWEEGCLIEKICYYTNKETWKRP